MAGGTVVPTCYSVFLGSSIAALVLERFPEGAG